MTELGKKIDDYVETREYWDLAHKYMRYAASGAVPYIFCPNDETELVITAKPSGMGLPALKCFTCGTVYNVGLHVWNQMKQNLKEADDE